MISASLIVKNEEKVLERCLKSLKGIDEIVICDTGSEDKTIKIAKKYGKVFTDYKWNDDFAEARNHAISKCKGNWILTIDADEVLEKGGVEKIRKITKEQTDVFAFRFRCISLKDKTKIHYQPRLYRNHSLVRWRSPVHNYLSTPSEAKSDITIYYGYSPAHKKDPDRALRILTKEYQKNPKHARTLYYLAREYWYRKDWIRAIWYWEECTKHSRWVPERADSYLYIGKCYRNLGQWEKARRSTILATLLDPDFGEAFDFLAGLSFPRQANRWKQIASTCENKNVIFDRMGEKKKKVYYCPQMKLFGKALEEMGFERYNPLTDIYEPTLFQGLYFRKDYDTLMAHKGERVVYWNGSDIHRLIRSINFQEFLKKHPATHLCIAKRYQARLRDCGVNAQIAPVFFGDFKDFPVSFKPGNEVFQTVHKGREKEYGLDQTTSMCKKYGLKLHVYGIEGKSTKNVIYHGWVPTKQMDKEIRNYQGALKFSQFGGGWGCGKSQTYVKSALLGQYPVAITDKNYEKKISQIKERTKPNLSLRRRILKEFNQFDWFKRS